MDELSCCSSILSIPLVEGNDTVEEKACQSAKAHSNATRRPKAQSSESANSTLFAHVLLLASRFVVS